MPLLKITPTHTKGRVDLSCELHYGAGEGERAVSFQTSLAVPDSVSEEQLYEREIAAMAEALAKARIRIAKTTT